MKYVFISDYIQEIGGGEMVDARLREFLGGEQVVMRCIDCSIDRLSKLKENRFIVSNFTALSEDCKSYLIKNCDYIIYEHDHKYLKTRNPSVFKDWKAPSNQLQNLEFYIAAKAVVCQTKQHQDVVILNTGLENTVNFGGSIWSNEQLDYLESLISRATCDVYIPDYSKSAILDSEIVHKGTRQAIEYCKQKNIEYSLLSIKDWKDFISDLKNHPQLVFFPQVLETCSRIAVEARMLGLKVLGNNNLSALKEEWFKQYKGLELIEYFRNKNKTLKEFIDSCFTRKTIPKHVEEDITVILNLYKRPQNLQKQIEAFRNQTVKPKEIWVWQNRHDHDLSINNMKEPYTSNINGNSHINQHFRIPNGTVALSGGYVPKPDIEINGVDKWITSNNNWGVYGRFTMAQMVKTKFVCINDDDTIPGPRWLETCLESNRTNPGLQGGIGVRLEADNYRQHHRIGWADPRPATEEVDLVGHSWFFAKEYLKYMWMEEPYTWNMEDAHFSYCLQKYGNIKTFVPPQFGDKSSSVLGYELGVDDAAMSNPKNHEKFYRERDEAITHYVKNGWKRVLQ